MALIDTFHQAQRLLKKGEKAEGQRLLHECLRQKPTDGPSWLALAKSELRSGNKTGARGLFEEALRHTESVHLLQAWAVMESDDGNVTSARQLFSRAFEMESGNSYVAHGWGLMEEREGHIERARELYESALASSPTPTVLASLAMLRAFHDNEPEAALKMLEDHADDPKYRQRSEELLLAKAHIHETVQLRTADASAALEEALARHPGSVKVRIYAAKLYLRLGDAARAETLLNDGRQMRLRDPWLYNTLASLQAKDQRLSEAVATITEGMKRFPFDGTLLQTAGTLAHRQGRLADATDFYRRSLQLRRHGSTYVAWAQVEEEKARREALGQAAATASPPPPRSIKASEVASEGVALVAAAAEDLNAHDFAAGDAGDAAEAAKAPSSAPAGGGSGAGASGGPSGGAASSKHAAVLDREWAKKNLAATRALFMEGLRADPNHGALYNAYANMEARYGNVTGARAIYAAGLGGSVSERQVSLYHGAGNFEASTGNYEAARRLWKAGISVGLRRARAMESVHFCYHSLGMSLLNAEHGVVNATVAARVFAEGLQRYPASSQLLLGAALAEVKRNHVGAARDFFRQSAAKDKHHAHAWQAWAVMETRERNHENAAMLFECGIENCPKHGALYQAYGMLQLYRGDVPAARKLFATGIQKCPQHVPLYQGWACLELRSGNLPKARDLLMAALAQDRKHAACWAALGELERQASRPEKARETFEKGLQECPTSARLFRAAARLEAELLDYTRARRLFQSGLERCPYDAALISAFAEFEASLGNIDALAALHRRAQQVEKINNDVEGDAADAPANEMREVLQELGGASGSWDALEGLDLS